MAKSLPKVWAVLLSWLAFALAFFGIAGLPLYWPWLRGAPKDYAAGVAVSMTGTSMIVGIVISMAAYEFAWHSLRLEVPHRKRAVARTGCLFVAVPSTFIAFFCTCAPLGLLAGAESSVQPVEQSWSDEIWMLAWLAGAIAVIVVAGRSRDAQVNESTEK